MNTVRKRRGLFSLLSAIVLLFCLAGCDEEYGPREGAGSWSVFLYLCGTDLESEAGAATGNLEELAGVELSEDVNYIIQTGGTQVWQNDLMDAGKLQRWETAQGDFELVDEQPLASMGDASTLGDFLTWGVETYPADRYMVVFWNHGGGSVAGVQFDELYDNDSLTLTELSQGLAAPGVKFEVIGFDTCLMASLETAAAVAPYGNYMVASEEYEPGGGWDYAAYPAYLSDNIGADGLAVGKAICDSYYAKCEAQGVEDMATLSVVDLNKVGDLVAGFDAMAAEMTGVTEDMHTFQRFIQGAARAESYGGNTPEEGYSNMVDLGDLVTHTRNVLPETADKILDALNAAVRYNVKGYGRSSAGGLSVFFPLEGYTAEELEGFARIAPSGQYVRFVEAATGWEAPAEYVADTQAAQSVVQEKDAYKVALSSHIDADGYFTLRVDKGLEAVSSVQFALYYMDYEYDEYMLMGYDNDMEGDWEKGVFLDNFRGVWMALNGQYCSPTLIAEEDGCNIYTIPIELNGVQTNLRAAYVWDDEENGHFEIHGVWDGIDPQTGMSAREITKLKNGDEVTLLFEAISWDTGETTTYRTGSFTVGDRVVLEEIDLFDGDYLYQYKVTDVFGGETWSDPVIMECQNGEISVYETEE